MESVRLAIKLYVFNVLLIPEMALLVVKSAKKVHEINKIVDRSKQAYDIGSKPNAVPSGLLVYVFFTVMFLGWSGFEYLSKSRVNEFLIVMGLGFGVMGIMMYRRIKKLNFNC